jgi:hypothetical protein
LFPIYLFSPFSGLSGVLSLSDSEKLRAAGRADALGGRPSILESYFLGILDFFLGPALKAISFH